MLRRIVSGFSRVIPRSFESFIRRYGTIFNEVSTATNAIAGGSWSLMPIRTSIRYHFPVAKETKRIKVHGYKKRMSTPEGRRILMRRILKGRHCLSH